MSSDRLKRIRVFVKERGYSQAYISNEVFGGEISRSYINKVLNGKATDSADDTVSKILDRMDLWIDNETQNEDVLYTDCWKLLSRYPLSVKRIVLKQLLRDI